MAKAETEPVQGPSEQEAAKQAEPKTSQGRVITEDYAVALFNFLATQKFADVDALVQGLRGAQVVTLTEGPTE